MRTASGQFVKGVSGNPNGRPRGSKAQSREQRMQLILERRTPELMECAFEQAPGNAEVMVGLLNMLTSLNMLAAHQIARTDHYTPGANG